MRTRIPVLPLPAVLILLLVSCARADQSFPLSLFLAPGMERTVRFTTEQTFQGGIPSMSDVPATSSISFTYRFRVVSVAASGTAEVDLSIADAAFSRGIPMVESAVSSLRRQRFSATIDRGGRLLSLRSDQAGVPLPGFPLLPGSSTDDAPARGDVGVLFGGLNGEKVAVGETWTAPLSQGLSSGLRGTMQWTLASLSGSTARLNFTGTLQKQELPVPTIPSDRAASLAGDATGFVELERDTGWPRRGQTVIRAAVGLREAGAPSGAAVALFSMRIVTRFDPAR